MRTGTDGASGQTEDADRLAAAIVAGFLIARLIFAYLLGPGIDESYTLAIARNLSLSYFDHPPLHQWIAHFAALTLGEGVATRLPFIVLFAASGWILYRLTRDLFGPRAATIALFSLNVAPFFFASAGTWVVPDGPLLFGLAVAGWALARLFFLTSPDRSPVWGLWLLAGAGLGVAGLSKYSAALSAAGLAAFVLLAPKQRRWLTHPAPYVAAAVALAMTAPVVMWNAEHGWASFQFQGARGAPEGGFRPIQVLAMAVGEIAYLFPWIFAPLAAGLAAAWRRRADERRLFLVCLALPPIVVFTITPLWGARGLPQWTMSGWFFAFPLMGAWLDERAIGLHALRRWASISSGALAAVAAVAVLQSSTGWLTPLAPIQRGVADPTLEALDWRGLREAPAFNPSPAFVISAKWSDAGKIALALGADIPVFVISGDPRGWAFVRGGGALLGGDGVLVVRAADLPAALAAARPAFQSVGAPQSWALTRNGDREIELALVPVKGLTRALPIPYPVAPH
ncbi:MAG TPA: glycosyltransferase family 39 protein [Roseiarcus sp.]|nr:glycosyltransferase family 39 protein [Roseiarcus sp.]